MLRLVAAWRALLRAHEPDGAGRCVVCGHARRWLFGPRPAGYRNLLSGLLAGWRPIERRPAGLCTVWQIAVGYFIRKLPDGVA
ncbi:hypothetical protein ACFWMR_16940 [Amycolatopsis thailandensis]|uniref:hypothetical protein n=1 Tax=Amycolatopsis thailandensis TaxID=589330 RepID=UPI003651F51D